jgi:hypothetical protein
VSGFFGWLAGWLGLVAVLIAVTLGLVALVGDDDSGDPASAGAIKKRRGPDPQCGRYYDSIREANDAELGYDRCKSEIEAYCAYGSASPAQLEGCETGVTWGQIKRLDTNAARYASGELEICLADAGPFCRDQQPENVTLEGY